jgi:hypothetical protein
MNEGALAEHVALGQQTDLPFMDHVHGLISINRIQHALHRSESQTGGSSLASHFQGQGLPDRDRCERVLVNAAYDFEDTSTGRFTGVSGVSNLNVLLPTGSLSRSTTTAARYLVTFSGNLHFPNAAQLAARP